MKDLSDLGVGLSIVVMFLLVLVVWPLLFAWSVYTLVTGGVSLFVTWLAAVVFMISIFTLKTSRY
jgi:hypothetical protein